MAMFTAYFDASGDPTHQFLVVAGYVANFAQWKSFDYTWRRLHEDNGVKLPFHAAEFNAALFNEKYESQRNARQDYVELAKNFNKATDFLGKLCMAQLTYLNCGISSIVTMDVYNGVSSLLKLQEVVPAYVLGARMCLGSLRRWERQFDIQAPVEVIFEDGDFEQGRLTGLMRDEGEPVPIFKNKNDFTGLQAADHYAWEQSFLLKQHEREEVNLRESFIALLSSIPKLHTATTTATLIDLCHAKGIDPRTGIKK